MVSTLLKFTSALQIPVSFIQYVMRGGRSVTSFLLVNRLKQYCDCFETIIDIGANKGQFAVASHFHFPNAKIYSFEPDPVVFKLLQQATDSIHTIELFNEAAGHEVGSVRFFRNRYSHASSILASHENQAKLFPKASETEEITVSVTTLDSFASERKIKQPILLKLDVQGFEKNVLLGARELLKYVEYVLLEVSFVPMYQDEPLFAELHNLLSSLGFQLIGPLDFLYGNGMQIVQMDALYQKTLQEEMDIVSITT